jgi:hypothetical protein
MAMSVLRVCAVPVEADPDHLHGRGSRGGPLVLLHVRSGARALRGATILEHAQSSPLRGPTIRNPRLRSWVRAGRPRVSLVSELEPCRSLAPQSDNILSRSGQTDQVIWSIDQLVGGCAVVFAETTT